METSSAKEQLIRNMLYDFTVERDSYQAPFLFLPAINNTAPSHLFRFLCFIDISDWSL